MRLGVAAAIVDGTFVRGDIAIEDGRLVDAGLAPAGSGIAVPGFVDLQVNGFAGVDVHNADAADYRRAAAALLEHGVTSFQPTLVTAAEEDLVAALAAALPEPTGSRILGFHLEGPFLSPGRLGAHDPAARRDPDLALLRRLLDAGPVTQMTLAPELPGATDAITLLRSRGVVVSLGHSDATAAEAAAGFAAGATTVTHLFNAMRPFAHREAGIAGAALARSDVIVQLIVDGTHLADETVTIAWRAAPARAAVVSDATAATAAGDGDYTLYRARIVVRDGVARTQDGVLAGSTDTQLDAVRRLVALGVALPDAVAAATSAPARILGRRDVGILRLGEPADVLVLDDRLELKAVVVPHAPSLAA